MKITAEKLFYQISKFSEQKKKKKKSSHHLKTYYPHLKNLLLNKQLRISKIAFSFAERLQLKNQVK